MYLDISNRKKNIFKNVLITHMASSNKKTSEIIGLSFSFEHVYKICKL